MMSFTFFIQTLKHYCVYRISKSQVNVAVSSFVTENLMSWFISLLDASFTSFSRLSEGTSHDLGCQPWGGPGFLDRQTHHDEPPQIFVSAQTCPGFLVGSSTPDFGNGSISCYFWIVQKRLWCSLSRLHQGQQTPN